MVTITAFDWYARIEGPIPDAIIEKVCGYSDVRPVKSKAESQVKIVEERRLYAGNCGPCEWNVPLSLASDVIQCCRDAKIQVLEVDGRSDAVCDSIAVGHRPGAIVHHQRGRIACRNVQEIANVITTVLQKLPKARCLFAYRSWGQVAAIRRCLALRERLRLPTRSELKNDDRWHERHLVPIQKLESCNPDDWDVVLTDADLAIFPQRRDRLAHLKQKNPACRLYATFDPDRRRTQEELFLQDALFGPILMQPAQPSIVVHWIDPGPVTIPADLTPLDRTNKGYWEAPQRLASLFRRLEEIAGSAIAAAPQQSISVHSDFVPRTFRVVILVDTPHHGRAVQAVFAGTQLETALSSAPPTGRATADDPILIATVSAADASRIAPADVVVLAGRSTPRKYFQLLETFANSRPKPVQVIIPADRFDKLAMQESQKRYRELAERRWQQPDAPEWLQKFA